MLQPEDPNWLPVSSFQQPTDLPTSDPDVGSLFTVCFNETYLPWVLGCLAQGLQESTWDTTDQAANLQAQERFNQLIYLFQRGCVDVEVGSIIIWPAAVLPSCYLECDGHAVSRTDFAGLYAVIGTTFGVGDGSTTFNLPDMRGRVAVGVGQQTGGTDFTLGLTGGEETHQLTVAELASHAHTQENTLVVGTSAEPPLDASGPNPLTAYTGNTGGDTPHNNLQPYLALKFIIKACG